MTTLDYYMWGAVKDKCYADKPETIDAVKDNIREATGEIQLHTINNVLKTWTDRSQNLKRRILVIFGFNRTALRATQPKLDSIF